MIKGKYSWNQAYRMVMLIKEEYESTFNDGEKDFKKMIEKLDCDYWNYIFDQLQVTQKGNLILLRYGLDDLNKGMWERNNSVMRECRSLVIDLEKGNIVLCPFRKFFNLNEIPENSIENIMEEMKNAKTIEFSNKLDGSMQSFSYYEGEIIGSGSRALDEENSWRLKDGYSMLTENHKKMIKDFPDWTFIFEFISLKDPHIVKYNKKDEGLYLLCIRNKLTGTEYSYSLVEQISESYNIKYVKIENENLESILEKSKTIKSSEKEGWVINIDGHKIKLKGDDYVEIHKTLTFLSSVNLIIKNIADGTMDDLISKVNNDHKDNIIKIYNKINERVIYIEKSSQNFFDMAPKNNQKEFMIWIDENVPKDLKKLGVHSYAKCKFLGKDYNILKQRNGVYYKKMNDIGLEIEIFLGQIQD